MRFATGCGPVSVERRSRTVGFSRDQGGAQRWSLPLNTPRKAAVAAIASSSRISGPGRSNASKPIVNRVPHTPWYESEAAEFAHTSATAVAIDRRYGDLSNELCARVELVGEHGFL